MIGHAAKDEKGKYSAGIAGDQTKAEVYMRTWYDRPWNCIVMAQSAISVIGVTSVMGEVNWLVVGSSALLSGILCILTALAGLPEVESEESK